MSGMKTQGEPPSAGSASVPLALPAEGGLASTHICFLNLNTVF